MDSHLAVEPMLNNHADNSVGAGFPSMIWMDSTKYGREVSLDFTAVRILCIGKRPSTDACFSERSLRHSLAGHPASLP